jgi:ferritin-like metal-binding protein YciE
MKLDSLMDVFDDQLADLHSAERQLIAALPKMAAAASDDKLRKAFEQHLEQTRGHLRRLEQIFSTFSSPVPQEHCEAMEGLVKEGSKVIAATGNPAAKDAALIAAAQRVEHYEIAAYGTARTLADQLDHSEARDLLDETLEEEGAADKLLTTIATGPMLRSGINKEAARA